MNLAGLVYRRVVILNTWRQTDKYTTLKFNIEETLRFDNKISIAVGKNLGKHEGEDGRTAYGLTTNQDPQDNPPTPQTNHDHPP